MPHFDCLIGTPPCAISSDDPRWSMPLPLDRHTTEVKRFKGPAITCGDYFTAACDYLSQPHISVPATPQAAFLNQASRIRIHLIKHGAFYHPAMITTPAADASLPLVLNVAVGPRGRKQMPIEIESLLMLEHQFNEPCVPRVYGAGSGRAPGHPPFPMFIGQWFVDFHEVHRTAATGPTQQWMVWDSPDGFWRFDESHVADFFRQAVRILTGCFDPHSLSAILDWHHGAGDFVVRRHNKGLDVHLITVRRYAPLFQPAADEPIDAALLLQALAAFWMRTSMWMRIDRIDGIGDLVWADGHTVAPMWKGFVQGLQLMAQRNAFPEAFLDMAERYFSGYNAQDWLNIGAQIVARYPFNLSEAALLHRHLNDHAAQTASIVQAA